MTESDGMNGPRDPQGSGSRAPSPADRERIDRYLAGRLTDDERNTIEARIVGDPSFRREVELTERLRAGLRDLEARGELDALLQKPAFWRQPAYALAATVAAAAFGLLALAIHAQLDQARERLAEMRRARGETPSMVAAAGVQVLSLVQTRSATGEPDAVVSLDRPVVLELHVDAGVSPSGSYGIAVERELASGRFVEVFGASGVGPSTTGEIVVRLNSTLLAAGEYRVRLHPESGEDAERSYRLRVER